MQHLDNAFIAMNPEQAAEADVIIFQKAYGYIINLKALQLKVRGKKIVFDVCDSEWLIPAYEKDVMEMMRDIADHITVPTEKMKELVQALVDTPITVIEDTMDMGYHRDWKKDHAEKEVPTLVWFGNRGTFKAFKRYIPDLETIYKSQKFKVRLISDSIDEGFDMSIPWELVKWDLNTVNQKIIECDVAINPKLDDKMDYAKSNNKTLTAWACGLPCVEVWSWTDPKKWKTHLIELLGNSETRAREGSAGRKEVEEKHRSEIAAQKITNLCSYLTNQNAKD